MILHKYQIILISLFLFPILAILFGNINIVGANLQFFFSLFSLIMVLFYLCKWGGFNRNFYTIPLLFSLIITIPLYNDKFGLIQIVYVISPFLFFFAGSNSNLNFDFLEKFKKYLKFSLIFVCSIGAFSFINEFSLISTRPVSIYLSLMAMISLILFNDFKYKLLAIFLVLFILISGARGALFASLFPLLFYYINKKINFKISIFLFLLIIVISSIFSEKLLSLVFSIEKLRERTFYDGIYSYEKILNFEFNSSGRENAWPMYWNHILGRFNEIIPTLIGEGPGAASKLGVYNLGEKWAHPHNEFLRILIDYGLIGLVSFLIFWIFISYRVIFRGDKGIIRLYTSLVFFGLIIAFTDNPLMYPLYFGNIVLFLMGLSLNFSRSMKLI